MKHLAVGHAPKELFFSFAGPSESGGMGTNNSAPAAAKPGGRVKDYKVSDLFADLWTWQPDVVIAWCGTHALEMTTDMLLDFLAQWHVKSEWSNRHSPVRLSVPREGYVVVCRNQRKGGAA